MDISTVAGCFTIELDGKQIVKHARLAYGGVALTPVRARKTEKALVGKKWDAETVRSISALTGKRVHADLGCAREPILSTATDLEFVREIFPRARNR